MADLNIRFTDAPSAVIDCPDLGISRTIDLGPNPSWPSPTERSDMLASAVRSVLDAAWTAESGEPIRR